MIKKDLLTWYSLLLSDKMILGIGKKLHGSFKTCNFFLDDNFVIEGIYCNHHENADCIPWQGKGVSWLWH